MYEILEIFLKKELLLFTLERNDLKLNENI